MPSPAFEFSLRASCFVRFLSAELRIAAGERCTAFFSTGAASFEGAVPAASARDFHDLAVSCLQTYGSDPTWAAHGLDGTDYRGSYSSEALSVPEFRFWSPSPGTPPHRLAGAAMRMIPLEHLDRSLEYEIELLREDLGIGVPMRWVPGEPCCLRIVGSLARRSASQIEADLAQAPAGGDLVVDVRCCDLHSIRVDASVHFARLAHRSPPARWRACARPQHDLLRQRGIPGQDVFTE